MKQKYEDDLTKALRCLGSQDGEGCCYEDLENMMRWESGENLIMCMENPVSVGKEQCPYYQKTYDHCFEDGERMYWLGKAADEIVSQRKELEELRAYKDLEEQGRLSVLPCNVGKYEKRLVDLEKAMDKSTLCDWYITSVSPKDEPVWTDRHIEELLNDFYVIPKEAEEVLAKEKGAIQS